jgi:hypothetical protein
MDRGELIEVNDCDICGGSMELHRDDHGESTGTEATMLGLLRRKMLRWLPHDSHGRKIQTCRRKSLVSKLSRERELSELPFFSIDLRALLFGPLRYCMV